MLVDAPPPRWPMNVPLQYQSYDIGLGNPLALTWSLTRLPASTPISRGCSLISKGTGFGGKPGDPTSSQAADRNAPAALVSLRTAPAPPAGSGVRVMPLYSGTPGYSIRSTRLPALSQRYSVSPF